MTNEEWRAITGYENNYEISNLGRVRSIPRIVEDICCGQVNKTFQRQRLMSGRILLPRKRQGNYLYVTLSQNGNTTHKRIHRLVAQAFIPNPDSLPFINHRDENPMNNRVENLE